MKVTFLLIAIMVFSSLVGSCDLITGETQSVPAEIAVGDKLDIPVKISFSDVSEGATEITILSVTKGTLKQAVSNPGATSANDTKNFEAGDPCIIISAEFKNHTGNSTLALLHADGFDANGIQRSWVLDAGPLTGLANYDIPAQSTTRMNITANWADKLSEIRIGCYIRHELYSLSSIPAIPEFAIVWFDEEWFVNNDMDPDPEYVKITFPREWLETYRADSFNGTGIQLYTAYNLIEKDNESADPDVITVRFPIDYFKGRPGAPITPTAQFPPSRTLTPTQ